MNAESCIVHHEDGAVSFVGREAVGIYRARVLISALQLWSAHRILPSRRITISRLLLSAEQITGTHRRRREVELAIQDLESWVAAQLPTIPVGSQHGSAES